MTTLVKLLAIDEDIGGYITYVFEIEEQEEQRRLGTKYIMTVQWPNWNCRKLELNEIGFLEFKEIRAGIDKWYDGTTFIPYRYNNIQFIKFIPKKESKEHKFIM